MREPERGEERPDAPAGGPGRPDDPGAPVGGPRGPDVTVDEPRGAADGEAEEAGRGPRRHPPLRRVVAALLALAFLAALVYPFLIVPRLRSLFDPLPRRAGGHVGAPVEVTAEALGRAEATVLAEIERGAFPGAALVVGQRGGVVLERGYGRMTWRRVSLPVDPDRTLYDLSSLTKVVATTAAVMLLVDDGRMRLDDPVSRWLPAFRGEGRERVTVRHLLAHTSGLQAGIPPSRALPGGTPREKVERLIAGARLVDEPGAGVLYSDIGFVLLAEAAARAAGEPLPQLLRRRVWGPLGMNATRFQPGLVCTVCAPTLSLRDGTPFAGKTNDHVARELGGVAGNAGLFSTAHDVGRFAAMLANGGELEGVRIVRAATLAEFARVQRGVRGLGFEWFCREGTVDYHETCGEAYAFGHTGYTGTSLWIDPRRGIWVVLLTNRTYLPRAANRIRLVRRRLFNTVAGLSPADSAAAPRDTAAERDEPFGAGGDGAGGARR